MNNTTTSVRVTSSLDRIAILVQQGFLDLYSFSVKRASSTMMCLDVLNIDPPDVYATPFGGIHFEWSKKNKLLLLEFKTNGTVEMQMDDVHHITTSLSEFSSRFLSEDIADLVAETFLMF